MGHAIIMAFMPRPIGRPHRTHLGPINPRIFHTLNPPGPILVLSRRWRMVQKIKQDGSIGANIRAVRKAKGIHPVELVRLLQLEGVDITREALVKIEGGRQHIQLAQLRGIRDALGTTYEALLDGTGV